MKTSPALFQAAKSRGRNLTAFTRFQDWTPGPNFGKPRRATFAELRKTLAEQIKAIRRIEESRAYVALRSKVIAETPACLDLIQQIRDLDNLPFTVRFSDLQEPLEARLETIIAGRIAELQST